MENGKNPANEGSALNRWLKLKKQSQPSGIQVLPPKTPGLLSYGQQRLWFLQQQHSKNPFYHYTELYRLKGKIDTDRLIAGIKSILHRHEIFKTTFKLVNGEVFQYRGLEPLYELSTISLGENTGFSRFEEAEHIAIIDAKRPFDLENGPLTRINYLQLKEDDFILVITMHHIITDKWSMRIFREELAAYYNYTPKNDHPVLPPLSIQYRDYAHWQRKKEFNPGDLDYWKKKLIGSSTFLHLPTDYPRPSVQSFRGAFFSKKISKELSKQLFSLSLQLNTTMFVLLLSVFKVLLHRYTHQDDILVGSPFTNRDRSELEKLIGFFNDTVVLHSDLSKNPFFSDFVKHIRETTLEGFSHKTVPFEKLIKELRLERTKSANPLFQAMFLYHIVPEPVNFGNNVHLETKPVDLGVSKFDLTLYISEEQDQLTAIFEYAKDLFEEQTISRMMGQFLIIAQEVTKDPGIRVGHIPLLTPSEKQKILVHWNDTKSKVPKNKLILHLFKQNVQEKPESVAVISKAKELSFLELDLASDQLAAALIRKGAGANIPIGLCVDRSVGMMIGILGILKSGSPYLPIDPDYPDERIRFMLEDAKVPIVVCDEQMVDRFENEQTLVQTLSTLENEISETNFHQPEIKGQDLAYLIYTSGSTGKPKGVAVTHSNLMHSTSARFDYYPEHPGCFLLMSSFSFDSSKAGIFWTIASGGTLVIPEKRIEQDLEHLGNMIHEHQVTHMLLLPSLYQILLDHITSPKLTTLRTIIVAGEACPTSLCQKHFLLLPDTQLYNEYGPTEATVWCSAHHILPDDIGGRIPIGCPISNTQIYILDTFLQPVPIGVHGELYIGGAGISNGYINQSERTESQFIPNPFVANQDSRLYKTGDLAAFRSNGIIDFFGRVDHQVKIRGYRIELDEIIKTILGHPSISDAIVIVHNDSSPIADSKSDFELTEETGRNQLAGYYTTQVKIEINDLQLFLKKRLPEYMVPAFLIEVDIMPRLPNGKINARGLPYPRSLNNELRSNFIAPRNPIEHKLAKVWSEVLKVSPLSIHDNFFDIGGDSILSIQIIAKARNEGIQLAPNQIFEQQTIAELALFAQEIKVATVSTLVGTGTFILTPIQRWFFEIHHASPHHWNHILSIIPPVIYNAEVFENAIQHLVEHHEVLRSQFMRTEDQWIANIPKHRKQSVFHYYKIPDENLAIQDQSVSNILLPIQANSNLSTGPLFQGVFVEFQDKRPSKLFLIAHHLVIDGVSWGIILQDLKALCEQAIQNQTLSLAAKTNTFKQWSNALKTYAGEVSGSEEISFWKKQIIGENIFDLGHEFGSIFTENEVRTMEVMLDEESTKSLLHEVPGTYQIKPDELLLIALLFSLREFTGKKNMCIGLEKHGREVIDSKAQYSNVVGWFTSYFPLSFVVDSDLSTDEILKVLKSQIRNVPQGGIGYGIHRYLLKRNELKCSPQVLFNYLGGLDFAKNEWDHVNFVFDKARAMESERENLIELNIFGSAHQLRCVWSFSKKHFKDDMIKKLVESYHQHLQKLIAHCINTDSAGFTPSDFPEAEISQDDLDHLLSQF